MSGEAALRPAGGYRPFAELARGGMGVTLIAVRPERRELSFVVIKRPRQELLRDPTVRARFHHEAVVATALCHPNLVETIVSGEDESGPYLILEYVHGTTLENLVDRAALKGRFLSMTAGVEIAIQVLCGLQALHEARDPKNVPLRAIHRDVSPQNVLVTLDGHVKLADFGIAKSTLSSVLTDRAALLGKLPYLAPEYLLQKEVSSALDVYAAAVTLFFALASRPPFSGESERAVLEQILRRGLPDVRELRPDVPRELSKLLEQASDANPIHRPNAQEFATALLSFLEDYPPSSLAADFVLERHLTATCGEVEHLSGADLRTKWETFRMKAHNLHRTA